MRLTPWVTRLIVANILVFILVPANTVLYALMTLFPPAVVGMDQFYFPGMPFRPWTAFTYMFLHAGIGHLLFNMLGLFFFGGRLETKLGARRFLMLYFLSGVGAAAFSLVFSWASPVVGASGAVYGILAGYAMFWPRENIYIYGVIPVQARILAGILVVFSLYSGFAVSGSGTAHFAHLGGLVVGAVYLKMLTQNREKGKREFQRKMGHTPSASLADGEVLKRWKAIDLAGLHEINRGEFETLISRVDSDGLGTLSTEDRRFLDRMAGFF
jgi:membrane associated rhomboid family serine protease